MTTLGDRIRRIPSWQPTLGLALFALGFLVTAQLRSEAPRVRYTSQERPPLVETALGLQVQQEALKARLLEVRTQIQDFEAKTQGNAALVRQLNTDLNAARTAAGLLSLEGTGVIFQLTDSTDSPQPGTNARDYLVDARDIRVLVEELWLAGAEAIAVNGERLVGATAILDIGGSVLVNSAYLAPPYQVAAIGPEDLYDLLGQAQGFRDFVRARAEGFGIKISYAVLTDVVVPAYAGTINLRYARPEPSPTPSSTPTPSARASAGPSARPTARPSARPSARAGASAAATSPKASP